MKFLHMADVHLGARPDAGHAWSEQREREIWDTFRYILEQAKAEKADLVLIAGDLFHRPPEESQLREADYLLAGLAPAKVVLIAGNHDYLSESGAMASFGWSPNVIPLFSKEWTSVTLPDLQVQITGRSYWSKEDREPLPELQAPKSPYTRILLLHGGDAGHTPFNAAALEKADFDYIALGHIHKPGALVPGKALYPGAPEPIDAGDTGKHGFILGEARGHRVKTSFIPAARRMYRKAALACREEDTSYSLQERLAVHIREKGAEDIWQIRLTGTRQPGSLPDTQLIREAGCILEVIDETKPAFDIAQLKQVYAGELIGQFIDSFERAPEDELQEKAFRYGLEALLEARREQE